MFQQHITKPSGTNAPGLGNEILLAAKSWFNVIATPPNPGVDPGDTVVITDNHTFLTSSPHKGFVRMYTTPRSGEIKYTQVGDIDSYGINGVLEAWSPGINIVLFELMAEQDEFIVLQKDIDCDNVRYFQLGASCSPALKRDWEFASGKAGGEGKKGTTIKFDSYSDRILLYEGVVSLAIQS